MASQLSVWEGKAQPMTGFLRPRPSQARCAPKPQALGSFQPGWPAMIYSPGTVHVAEAVRVTTHSLAPGSFIHACLRVQRRAFLRRWQVLMWDSPPPGMGHAAAVCWILQC